MERDAWVNTIFKTNMEVMNMDEQTGNTVEKPEETSTNGAEDMLALMGRDQRSCTLGQWMKCLRKPALSLQYTLDKRHIPNMDGDPTGKTPVKGANEDVMSVAGGFTIRYFDLAAGVVTLILAGCVLKALCRVRRWM